MFVYTAGATAWTSGADGGTIRITLPAGWTPPEVEEGYAGNFRLLHHPALLLSGFRKILWI